MTENNKIIAAYYQLLDWIELNGWEGYDPYDIKGQFWFIRLQSWGNKSRVGEIFREIIVEGLLKFPRISRKIFRVEKKVNSKAMGLFASSFLDLYKYTSDKKYLVLADECLEWLYNNRIETNNSGIGWGYPFDWQSVKFIPKDTPNGIATTAVGEAFWKRFKLLKEKKDLDICKQIASFLFSLPISEHKGNICFSYTPIFINYVHNLNLFVAEYLIKIGIESGNKEWVRVGIKAVNYTLEDQREDGSFDYNGPPETPQNFCDNYHTCFVMRMLQSIYHLTNDERIFSSLSRCYRHYCENFFKDGRIPKFTPDRLYRIDIHSSAEAINCLSLMDEDFPGSIEKANKIALWTIDNLQDKEGYFYHGVFKDRIFGGSFISKIPYIRWGQAWMLRAFASLIPTMKMNTEIGGN